MSDTPKRPDWRRMQPDAFKARVRSNQDALFLVDEPDACGTEALEGFGYGASFWGGPPDVPADGSDDPT
ncbi:hypothetical protein BX257_3968 [Streptomyces sp. 3212.3]|uniref:hypothetical protein n=1 Tax=Streptomyces sp. 3212.3 TaxID=1938846 RepID=UPI000E264B9F|nr:hypothetical protein [Streptomyces sp. 3212.3]REE61391.1 hypothetical protein BX257_3968 [Streptomyces sp. 3212.3]